MCPALDEVKRVVNLPVISAGVCGAHAASMVGERVGIIGITDSPPKRMVKELGELFHLYAHSVSYSKSTELFAKETKEVLLQLSIKLIDEGADVILFGCTGFSTIQLKSYLNRFIKTPVIDLVEAQAMAYNLLKPNKVW